MAKILVEKQVCPSCGAGVRPRAVFCYNCGGAVTIVPEKLENKNGNGSDGDVSKRKNALSTQLKEKKTVGETIDEIDDTTNNKPELPTETKLKSAAAMRRKPKAFQKKEVEIVWEEQENPSSLLLIATALLLAIFAAAVIILAMTLK
jgi:ribosomal protein L40E